MSQNPEEPMFAVRDKNARGDHPRVHDMPGARYPLWAHKDTPVPERHALMFLRDSAFEVRDETGRMLASVEHLANERDASRELDPDETIAKYAELTSEALLARAVLRPGAGTFNRRTPRAELVAFLTSAPMKQDLPRHERARDTSTPEDDVRNPDLGADIAAKVLGTEGRDPKDLAAEAAANALMGA